MPTKKKAPAKKASAAQKKPAAKKDTPQCPPPALVGAELAHDYYEKLTNWIVAFEKGLKEDEEVSVRLVSFGDTITFVLTDISFQDPALISFKGQTDDGSPVELIQHINQISILLMRQKITKPVKGHVPIGFKLEKKIKRRKKS